eukprot:9938645-Lingulodinium_polyedra.AAC.1
MARSGRSPPAPAPGLPTVSHGAVWQGLPPPAPQAVCAGAQGRFLEWWRQGKVAYCALSEDPERHLDGAVSVLAHHLVAVRK